MQVEGIVITVCFVASSMFVLHDNNALSIIM